MVNLSYHLPKSYFDHVTEQTFLGNTLSVLKLTEQQYRRRFSKTETTIQYHIGLHRASDQILDKTIFLIQTNVIK